MKSNFKRNKTGLSEVKKIKESAPLAKVVRFFTEIIWIRLKPYSNYHFFAIISKIKIDCNREAYYDV